MNRSAKAYANNDVQTSVASSSSEELIILVYEKIFEHLRVAKLELIENRYGIEFFTKASDLINLGLLASLDLQKGGEIASNLRSIYEWALDKILEARLKKSPEMVQDVINTLTPLYEAWVFLGDSNISSNRNIFSTNKQNGSAVNPS
jgi:flagellar protein FliS